MKILFFNTKKFELEYLKNAVNPALDCTFIEESLTELTVEKVKGFDAISVFTNDTCNASIIEIMASYGLKFISTRSAGFDHIDVAYTHSKGITVANVPEYSPFAIAEHIITLIMCLNRHVIEADNRVKDNNFKLDGLIGFDMNTKTVGIVGMGRIGSILAKLLHAFGCKLLVHDIKPLSDEVIKAYQITTCNLDELYSQSDIITLQIPLSTSTKYLINKTSIDKMKDGVMIINTARGPILNSLDCIEGLKSGKIGSLGLDVYEKEKGMYFYDQSDKVLQDDTFALLKSYKNVLITGHQAFLTKTALENITDTTFESLNSWSKGLKSKYEL